MTARPMTELMDRAREIVADDLSAMTASWLDTQAFARALLSTSAAERGMREALQKMGFGAMRDDELIGWRGPFATSGDFFRCEFCGHENRDSTLIEHEADCPVFLARAALSGIEREDEQARGQGRSASTDTKEP